MSDIDADAGLEGLLAQKTVRDPAARAVFIDTVRGLASDQEPWSVERLDRLMRAEEHFQALLLYDQIDFLRAATLGAAERELAHDVQRICLETANGLQRFLRNRAAWSGAAEPELAHRVTGLAVHAIHGFVKWSNFLEEAGRATPWRQLHALYALAEGEGYAQVPFALHPTRPSFRPSVQSLYLRALVLDLLNIGNLSRVQVEVADGWFSSWCNDYALEFEYSSRLHLFFVDLESDEGMHLMRKDAHGEAFRYLRAEALKGQIEEVQGGLRQGRLHAGYGAGAVFPVEEHVAVLAIIEKLYHSILAGSENRIEERESLVDREVDVAVGIERVLRKVRDPAPGEGSPGAEATSQTVEITPAGMALVDNAPSAEALPFDALQADPDVDRWRVQDLSSRGFGLLVDRVVADGVMLNGLIAIRSHETGAWMLGTVVRKQALASSGEVLLGVEILSFRPIAVDLAPENGEAAHALYLPGFDTNGKQDALLVRPADFGTEGAHGIRTGGAVFRVRMNRIIRKGPDWVSARFELVSKA